MNDDLLREILAELRQLRREVGELRAPPPSLRAGDADALARLLPVLQDQYGAARFGAWEVADAARMPGPAGTNVRAALGARSAHSLGQLLARGQGAIVGGRRVLRDGRGPEGAHWRVVA